MGMSCVLWKDKVGGLRMSLRESAASNYTLVYEPITNPLYVGIIHLGTNRNAAVNIYLLKLNMHRSLVNDSATVIVEA
jgi:hypothetical protein